MREMDGVHGRDYILHVSHDAASVGWGGEHATRESRCAELHLTSRRYTTLSNSTVKSDEINGAPHLGIRDHDADDNADRDSA